MFIIFKPLFLIMKYYSDSNDTMPLANITWVCFYTSKGNRNIKKNNKKCVCTIPETMRSKLLRFDLNFRAVVLNQTFKIVNVSNIIKNDLKQYVSTFTKRAKICDSTIVVLYFLSCASRI